jgi:ABC-type transport system substrate-binding protein
MNSIFMDGRIFKDVRVRRAISMAIERSALVDTYANVSQLRSLGAEEKFHNVGVPASFARWWLDPTGTEMGSASHWYEYTPKEAIALLSAAGVTHGTEVPFRYRATGSASAFSSIAQSSALMLKEVGIQTRIHREDPQSGSPQGQSSARPEGIVFAAAAPHTDIDDWLMTTLHSSGHQNQAVAPDKSLDKLIEDQQVAPTLEARRSLIHEIQRLASDRMYMVPTAAGTAWTAVRPRVRNFEVYLTNSGNYGQAGEQWQWLHLNG